MTRNVASSTAGAGPADPPVSVAEVTGRLAITDLDDDDDMRGLIDAGAEEARKYCRSRFVTQTRIQFLDEFADPIFVRWPPLQSVTSITYVDTDGNTQTLSSTRYETAKVDGVDVVRLSHNQSWPAVRTHEDVIQMKYVCGYGGQASVPAGVKRAITLYAGHRFEYREGELEFPRDDFESFLDPYKFPEIR